MGKLDTGDNTSMTGMVERKVDNRVDRTPVARYPGCLPPTRKSNQVCSWASACVQSLLFKLKWTEAAAKWAKDKEEKRTGKEERRKKRTREKQL